MKKNDIKLSNPIKVLFVCLGNICRSPIAEGVFKKLCHEKNIDNNFIIDSAGTSDYHVGNLPDIRAISHAKSHHILLNHFSRQFKIKDFDEFDYILVMDHLNYEDVIALSRNESNKNKVMLFRSFDSLANNDYDLEDPYYGTAADFEEVITIAKRSATGFIEFLREQKLINYH